MTQERLPYASARGDMAPADFRELAHRVADLTSDFLAQLESYDVCPQLEQGQIREKLPSGPPQSPEAMDEILADYQRLVVPNLTQWQHPGFLAYFSSVASGPGILAEWLVASLNSNVMFWRNAPASTELEEVMVDWLRQMLGLPPDFDGMLTDTASISTLTSLVAAREAVAELNIRQRGLSCGPTLTLYCSQQAHSSVEKAAIIAGIGTEGVRRIAVDRKYRMIPEELGRAIEADRAAGRRPFFVVATLGTTSSTSVDPVADIVALCQKHGLWLHVDAAYAGAAALLEEKRSLFDGWQRADSIVVNPHKWMFTPLDASLLLFRHPEIYRRAFSIVPEYLQVRESGQAHDYHEYSVQLGRRFRALKLWFIIRYFGVDGMAARIREHCVLANEFASWVASTAHWEVVAPIPFATVCFRFCPPLTSAGLAKKNAPWLDELNRDVLERVNRTGRVYLSHTRLDDRLVLRVAIGNPRTELRHLEQCWSSLQEAASEALAAAALA